MSRRARVFLALLVLLGVVAQGVAMLRPYKVGPAQPIPFSHKVHAGDKQIDCFFCHATVDRSAEAGMPEMSTCMLCHEHVAPWLPPVFEERQKTAELEVIEWIRVIDLPDFAHFNHAMHLQAGVDCGVCHGNVKSMDRITMPHALDMGFCVDCHRENGASDDCFVCHY